MIIFDEGVHDVVHGKGRGKFATNAYGDKKVVITKCSTTKNAAIILIFVIFLSAEKQKVENHFNFCKRSMDSFFQENSFS